MPANYSITQQNQGSDASDSDANGMGMTDVVNLSPGENDPTIDLGIEPSLASLGDYVWFDLDHDGQQDGSETGVPGVTVQLFDLGNDGVKGGGDDNLLASDTTDVSGNYGFDNLQPGDYYVMFDLGTLPANYSPTQQNQGADASDSDANGMGMTDVVNLSPGENDPTIDLGIFNPVQPIFDLALRKRLAPAQPQYFKTGDPIQFTVTVFNQGNTDAYNVQVVDYLPVGLSTADANWTGTSGNIFTQIAFLAAGDSVDVPLSVTVSTNFNQFMELVNYAEISAADDDTDTGNTPPTDIDSDPDTDPNNDNGGVPNSPTDDEIGDDGTTDEDDHDPSSIIIIVPADPDGFIYCDKTGKLVTGGTISVTGPGGVTIIEDGSDGTPGTYTISYSHPNGYPISTSCPAQSDTLDLSILPEGYVIGTNTLDSTGMYLGTAGCAENPWYQHIYFGLGDSLVFGNNIAVQCVFIGSLVCEDVDHDDVAEPTDPGFPGLTVHLYNCADTLNPIASTVTDSLGEYRFDGLTAGDYRVQFVMPGAHRPTVGSNVDPGGFSPCITLAWSECDTAEYLCLYACPPVNAGADTTICFGDTVQMQASVPWGSGSFSWTSASGGLSDDDIANPLAFPTVSTEYEVGFDDGLGCNQDVDSVAVNVLNTAPYLTYTPFIIATVECDEPRPFDAPVFADSCDNSLTITLDSTIGNMACDLVITRTWTATNDQGNSASFMQTVVVIDTT
ncbi:MAG: SdrD B-like domain-containing protein, partial [Planctomycetota bacterium]